MTDGLIQQRGYYDIRISTEKNIAGSVSIDTLDPLDVIPDPDARDYHPSKWKRVLIVRWMTYDEIEGLYGVEARRKVESVGANDPDSVLILDFEKRNRFGDDGITTHDHEVTTKGNERVAVIERQEFRMVDNATSPQDLLNKSVSQELHILNTSANSGWMVWENSLANMSEEELASQGAKTGLVLVVRQNTQKPEKILPNPVPSGIDRMVQRGQEAIKQTTGVNDTLQGQDSREVSGIAIQSKQFMGLTGLSMPLDNLNHTRKILAGHLLWFIQNYYTDERVLTITGQDDDGNEKSEQLAVNRYDQSQDKIVNDLTIGEYDVVITEQPSQITFGQSQLAQALELRGAGVAIPDDVLISHSTLSKKRDILDRMKQAPPPDPLKDAEIALKQAQADKTASEATNKRVESQYSAIQTAQTIATVPGVAPLADTMLKSAGYQDMDMPPIVPGPMEMPGEMAAQGGDPMQGMAAGIPQNTNPLTPANPGVGLNDGIETQANDGVIPQ